MFARVLTLFLFIIPSLTSAQSALPIVHGANLVSDQHVIVTAPIVGDEEAVLQAENLANLVSADVVAVWPLAAIGEICYVLRLPARVSSVALETLSLNPDVRSAQPMGEFEVLSADYTDELVQIQENLKAMNVFAAHAYSKGSSVKLALIDSAVDARHPDLNEQMIVTKDMVDPAPGEFVAERHGTAMAGLIVADDQNGKGMVGIAPNVELMALRACWAHADNRELCNSFTLARAVNFAIVNGADVVNLSLGGPEDPLLARLIAAAEENGIVVVAAHGPETEPWFPASELTVVAASEVVKSSALTLPSRDVLSAIPGKRYDFFSGDSVASAQASGLVALLLSANPSLTPKEVRDIFLGDVEPDIDICKSVVAVSDNKSLSCD